MEKNPKGKQQANIYDIAKRAGVSIATVSRVLNKSAKVSEKYRKKVAAVMKEMGYEPNVFARGMGLNSMSTVGIMCTDASDPFLSGGLYYAELAFRKQGYSTVLASTGNLLEDKKKAMEQMLSKRIDGLLLFGSSFLEKEEADREYIRRAAAQIPIMIVNGPMKGENIYSVCCTDFEATFQVVERLLQKGRRNILYLYCADTYSGQQKLRGYRAALGAFGIMVDPSRMLFLPRDLREMQSILIGCFQEKKGVDGVVVSEDLCAVAALKAALEAGLSIPEEMDIVGYNNSLLSLCTTPELTTVDNQVELLAGTAAGQLIKRLRGEEIPWQMLIPYEIIVRDSARL